MYLGSQGFIKISLRGWMGSEGVLWMLRPLQRGVEAQLSCRLSPQPFPWWRNTGPCSVQWIYAVWGAEHSGLELSELRGVLEMWLKQEEVRYLQGHGSSIWSLVPACSALQCSIAQSWAGWEWFL